MGEDVWRQTRERIAESTPRVNYYIGTVRMICGKVVGRNYAEIPSLRMAKMGHPACLRGFVNTSVDTISSPMSFIVRKASYVVAP
jgi:hypothetical protein